MAASRRRPAPSSGGSTVPGCGPLADPPYNVDYTLIACANAWRQARLVELDPRYVDVVVQRWRDFSGERAVLEGAGRGFEEVVVKRLLSNA